MRLLSLSEASIQPRTSLSQFGGDSIPFFICLPKAASAPVANHRVAAASAVPWAANKRFGISKLKKKFQARKLENVLLHHIHVDEMKKS